MSEWIRLPGEYAEAVAGYGKNDEQSKALVDAFEAAVNMLGWELVNAPDGRTTRERNKKIEALETARDHFIGIGHMTTAKTIDEEIDSLRNKWTGSSKKEVRDSIRGLMLEWNHYAIPKVFAKKEFDEISRRMKELFVEYCEEYPPSAPYWLADPYVDPDDLISYDPD